MLPIGLSKWFRGLSGSSLGGSGWHFVNWNIATRDKTSGGLGIKNMEAFNTALMGKAIWHLLQHSNKLWVRALEHKYIRKDSVLSFGVKGNPSPV